MVKRVWFDVEIGTNPDVATALLFALKHPGIEVLGISISGSERSIEQRMDEAKSLLEYADQLHLPLYKSSELNGDVINSINPDHTIVSGALYDISRLILDETNFGQINIFAGMFSQVNYRGTTVSIGETIAKDIDSARVIFSQSKDLVISSFDATNTLFLDSGTQSKLEKSNKFLKARFEGYGEYLETKYEDKNTQMIMHSLLPVCDILKLPGITRETIEFYIQPDGSLFPTYELIDVLEPIREYIHPSDIEKMPMPKVKQEVIRSIVPKIIFEELLNTLT